jgi:hypothetical protein
MKRLPRPCAAPFAGLQFLQAAQNGQSANTPAVGLSLPQNAAARPAPVPLPGAAPAAR